MGRKVPVQGQAHIPVSAVASLFFKYHEQQDGSIAEFSPRAFNDRKANTALLAAVGCVLLVLCGYSIYRYGDTVKDIRSPSSRPDIVAHRGGFHQSAGKYHAGL